MKAIRNIFTVVIITVFVLPGSAFAIQSLSLRGLGTLPSGTILNDPVHGGFDVTIVSSTGGDLKSNTQGMGVGGGLSNRIDSGEGISIYFTPDAFVKSLTLVAANGDTVWALVDSGTVFLNTVSGTADYDIAVEMNAGLLQVLNIGTGSGFRIGSIQFVPEPAIIGLLGIGLIGFCLKRGLRNH